MRGRLPEFTRATLRLRRCTIARDDVLRARPAETFLRPVGERRTAVFEAERPFTWLEPRPWQSVMAAQAAITRAKSRLRVLNLAVFLTGFAFFRADTFHGQVDAILLVNFLDLDDYLGSY